VRREREGGESDRRKREIERETNRGER